MRRSGARIVRTQLEVRGGTVRPQDSPVLDANVLPDLVQRASIEADGVAKLSGSKERVTLLLEVRRDLCMTGKDRRAHV